jgi:tRNA U34 5-carboxymethylaminomethyl modifying enzyme MnmG/GidA
MKIKILLGFILIFIIGVGYLSMKEDNYRENEIQYIKKIFISNKIEECLSKQKKSVKNVTEEEKRKCKLSVNIEWEEVKTLNSQY